jgi:hypothetical protein
VWQNGIEFLFKIRLLQQELILVEDVCVCVCVCGGGIDRIQNKKSLRCSCV